MVNVKPHNPAQTQTLQQATATPSLSAAPELWSKSMLMSWIFCRTSWFKAALANRRLCGMLDAPETCWTRVTTEWHQSHSNLQRPPKNRRRLPGLGWLGTSARGNGERVGSQVLTRSGRTRMLAVGTPCRTGDSSTGTPPAEQVSFSSRKQQTPSCSEHAYAENFKKKFFFCTGVSV